MVQLEGWGREAAGARKAAERWPERWNMKEVQGHDVWRDGKMAFQVRVKWGRGTGAG